VDETQPLFRAGELLNGNFEIRSLIGQGGMGQVFEAFDVQLSRSVAVKALLPGMHSPWLREEARALAAFSHPSVVTIYAMGRHREIDFIVMERLYGSSLALHLAKRTGTERMAVDEVLDVCLALSDGLTQLHRASVAHRDIKPGNIMLCPGNRVVLLDFGLVLPESDVSASSDPCGTPQYMAPEIVSRSVMPGDRKLIDLYALGTIAFEMLVGAAPFPDGTPEQIMQRQLYEMPPRVSTLRPDVPEELDELLSDLLAKDPKERPQSAEEVSWTLRQIRNGAQAEEAPSLSVGIVDDDAHSTRLLSLYVRSTLPQAQIRTARDGEAGLSLVRESIPDLLLLDLQMPGMNGLELAMYLRSTHQFDGCRIVALSGRAGEHDLRLLRELGITEFIPKSAQTKEQLTVILQDLARQRKRSRWSGGRTGRHRFAKERSVG
jgi:serine/threonine-protein kinase